MAALAPIVQELSNKIKEIDGWDTRFRNAVKAANESGVAEMRDIKTLKDYLQRINGLLTWIPSDSVRGRNVCNP